MYDGESAEDDKRLKAYMDFLMNPTELIRIERDDDINDHVLTDLSSVDDDKYGIINRAFSTIENHANNMLIYKSIKVDIKISSPMRFKLLTEARQKIHDKNLKRETYWATLEKRADDEMSATKVETLSFKDVWEDLIHMESTKKFCKYLTDSPGLTKPKYLVDVGLFENIQNVKKTKKKRTSSRRQIKYHIL